MDLLKLIRDPKHVHSVLRELDNGRLVTTKDTRIYIPVRFVECGLAYVGIETNIVGIYAIVVENQFYGVSTINAMHKLCPTSTTKVSFNEEEYYEFYFEPGATIFESVNLVKNDMLVYKIYDELIAKGNIPWYLGYKEMGKIFDSASKHAGLNIGKNHEVTELLISMIARVEKDRHLFYRTAIKSEEDIKKIKPAFIGLRNVTYAATNTLNRLGGSYFEAGLISSLVSPSTRKEKIESILTA